MTQTLAHAQTPNSLTAIKIGTLSQSLASIVLSVEQVSVRTFWHTLNQHGQRYWKMEDRKFGKLRGVYGGYRYS